MNKIHSKGLKNPNRNKPDNIVMTVELMRHVKDMLNEINTNTHTYRGQIDKQKETAKIISGIILFHYNQGSISRSQYESLYATSSKCYAKGNISKELPRDDNRYMTTVEEYYNPPQDEMFANMQDETPETNIEEQMKLMIEAFIEQDAEIKELKAKINKLAQCLNSLI